MRAALAAGWRRADLWWERLQEGANRDLAEGRRVAARRRFRLAGWLAAVAFASDDPRLATSLANTGRAARALALWPAARALASVVELRPRARSSLHHLRLELRHRGAYEARARARLAGFAAEAEACLEAAARGAPPPHRLYARWRGEKPPVFDEGRKLLAACLLIAASPGAAV